MIDFEFIVDNHGQRITSFSGTAGLVGMATGILAWCRQTLTNKVPTELLDASARRPLLETVQNLLDVAKCKGIKSNDILVLKINRMAF